MIYRRLLPFETTKNTDDFLIQDKDSKGNWRHGKSWANAGVYGWNNKKVKECVGNVSGIKFKFRRRLI